MSAWPTPLLLAICLGAWSLGPATAQGADALVPAGRATPFERIKPVGGGPSGAADVAIAAFRLGVAPVTNGQFRQFVAENPEWRRSRVKPLFADPRYLARWTDDLTLPDPAAADEPATDVSWFAARAYCRAQGRRLPTTQEWEYALADDGRGRAEVQNASLAWFARPNDRRPGPVGQGPANGFGLRDMVGLIWEWTLDFDAFGFTAESRDPNGKADSQFCGGAAAGVSDPSDYPAFMRYALRGSLKAKFVADNLGFRCAGEP